MKKLLTAAAVFFSAFAFAQNKQQRIVTEFSGISGATGIQVELTQGNENAVSVAASDEKYLEYIITKVENGVLKIYYNNPDKTWSKDRNRKLYAYVTYKSIYKIMGNSGSTLTAMNTVNASSLMLNMSSGSEFNGEIKATDLKIDQSSGAMSKVSGTVANVKADLSSGAIFTGIELNAETCKASASTGAILKIGVSKKLTAIASTGGVVNYKGEPDVQKSTSLGGVVSKI